MSILLVYILGCGWWEKHQACSAAQEADAAAWAELQVALDAAAEASARQAEASVAAVKTVEVSLAQAVAASPAPSAVSRGEAAQDAFTRTSRVAGTDKALADARWMDWTMRTQEQAREAERLSEQATRELERLELWGRAQADGSLALALASARYEARVRSGPARLTLSLDATATLAPSAAPEPEKVATLRDRLGEASVGVAELRRDMTRVLGELDALAFRVDSAGQTASSSGRNYDFLGFPPEAQIAQAAALAATSAGGRATESAATLRAVVKKWRTEVEGGAVQAPGDVADVLAKALGLAAAADEACR